TYRDRAVQFFVEKLRLTIANARPFAGVDNFSLPGSARHGDLLGVGEAAGFQDAAWGFGMRYAVISGHLAAKAIMSDTPCVYDQMWRKRLAGIMRASLVNRFVFSLLGKQGYHFMVHRLGRARDGRIWLHRYCKPRLWKTAVYPLAQWVLGRRCRNSA